MHQSKQILQTAPTLNSLCSLLSQQHSRSRRTTKCLQMSSLPPANGRFHAEEQHPKKDQRILFTVYQVWAAGNRCSGKQQGVQQMIVISTLEDILERRVLGLESMGIVSSKAYSCST